MTPPPALARLPLTHTALPPVFAGAPVAGDPRDVRLIAELAHRRFLVSLARRLARAVTLHALDASAMLAALAVAERLTGAPTPLTAPGLVALLLFALHLTGSYKAGEARRSRTRLAVGVLLAAVTIGLAAYRPETPWAALPLAGLYFAILFTLLAAARTVIDWGVQQLYRHGIGLRRGVVLGGRRELDAALRVIGSDSIDHEVVGFVTVRAVRERGALGHLGELGDVLTSANAEELVVATPLPEALLREAVRSASQRGARCYALPWALTAAYARSEPVRLGRCPAFRLHPPEFEIPELLLKRALDLALTLLALPVTVALTAFVALAIRLDTPGPVFYRQRRIGVGGRPFVMWKFRSMHAAAEQAAPALAHLNEHGTAPIFKLRADPRVTRVGRLLRRTSLDELPQLLNVLRGEMSLVGPRPPLPDEVARYAPHHYDRLSVVPGITGPWQVSGRNLITDFEHVVRLERDYIMSWSLLSDLRILLRTVGVVARGTGAF